MGAKIHNIAYYLPEFILTNQQLEKEFPEWTAEKVEEKTGIRSRHIAGENETALDMAFQAAQKVLHGYEKPVEMLLFCTQSPDYMLPTSACILQDKLGLPRTIGAYDFNLGCSGYIYGLAMAKGFINSGIAANVLLVTSETYSKYIHPLDKGNRTIFGDGASATIIEKCEKEQVFEFIFGTDGSGFDNLIVPNGGARNAKIPDAGLVDDGTGNMRTDNHLFMNGPEIFNFTIQNVPKSVQAVLDKNNTTLENIDYVVFHQANKYMLDYLRKKVKIPEEKFYIHLTDTGNMVSSTIPVALAELLKNKAIKTGDKVLLCGFGVGYSWGATIIEI
jgi:3-oxoacyl-[acyl-carrier-protein] synthase III